MLRNSATSSAASQISPARNVCRGSSSTRPERVEIAGVRQLVEVDDADVRLIGDQLSHEATADEAGPAGDKPGSHGRNSAPNHASAWAALGTSGHCPGHTARTAALSTLPHACVGEQTIGPGLAIVWPQRAAFEQPIDQRCRQPQPGACSASSWTPPGRCHPIGPVTPPHVDRAAERCPQLFARCCRHARVSSRAAQPGSQSGLRRRLRRQVG